MTTDPILPGTGPAPRARRPPAPRRPAAGELPVARVVLMLPVPHLDRVFDYEVPETLAEAAVPGVRVRVRFAGRLVDGFLLERGTSSEHELAPLRSVHGPSVLTPEVLALCRAVAERYAGTLADVLRFAVPARHARAEARTARSASPAPAPSPPDGAYAWASYAGGAELLARIGGPQPVRAAWLAGPGESPARRIAELAAAVVGHGRGVVVVVPDAAALDQVHARLADAGLAPIRLAADLGPEARYRAFLRVLGADRPVVVGTRAAVFAPVADLGAIVVWDDGDESLAEPQAPGWHAREVAALRAAGGPVSLVVGGTAMSLEAARMVQSGWLAPVALPRPLLRSRMPRIEASGDLVRRDPATARDRIPAAALAVLREGVHAGPVLVGVPRAGYQPLLACQACREPVRCPECGVPMRAEGPAREPSCPVHGARAAWRCPLCGGPQLRAAVTGVRRTAEEFGRALPGTTVLTASGEHPVRQVPAGRVLVVATPGSEPDPGPEGYAACVLLDALMALSRPGLRVAEEVLRRWFAAAALVRAADRGGHVLVVGPPDVREVQALVRWDPGGYADRELAERRALHLPPAVRLAQLSGPALPTGELAAAVAADLGPAAMRVSGPLAGADDEVTWLVAASMADGPRLAAAVRREQALRSARRAPVVTSRMDPVRLR